MNCTSATTKLNFSFPTQVHVKKSQWSTCGAILTSFQQLNTIMPVWTNKLPSTSVNKQTTFHLCEQTNKQTLHNQLNQLRLESLIGTNGHWKSSYYSCIGLGQLCTIWNKIAQSLYSQTPHTNKKTLSQNYLQILQYMKSIWKHTINDEGPILTSRLPVIGDACKWLCSHFLVLICWSLMIVPLLMASPCLEDVPGWGLTICKLTILCQKSKP
jgi:hypothetical protein